MPLLSTLIYRRIDKPKVTSIFSSIQSLSLIYPPLSQLLLNDLTQIVSPFFVEQKDVPQRLNRTLNFLNQFVSFFLPLLVPLPFFPLKSSKLIFDATGQVNFLLLHRFNVVNKFGDIKSLDIFVALQKVFGVLLEGLGPLLVEVEDEVLGICKSTALVLSFL